MTLKAGERYITLQTRTGLVSIPYAAPVAGKRYITLQTRTGPVTVRYIPPEVGSRYVNVPDGSGKCIALGLTAPWIRDWSDHDFKAVWCGPGEATTVYGDTPMTPTGGCLAIRDGTQQHGDVEFAWSGGTFEHYPYPDDASMCIKFNTATIDIWICSAPYSDYGSGVWAFYILDTLIWQGNIIPNFPGRVFYNETGWSPPAP